MRSAVDRYVENLLRGRRPRPFAPSEDDLAVIRTAISLAAAGPQGAEPDQAFVEGLRRRLAERAASGPPGEVQPASPQPAAQPRAARTVPARRRLLQATALSAGAAAVGATADHLISRATPAATGHPASAQVELTPVTGTWQTVVADAQLPEGGVLEFDLGTVTGFVQRTSGRVQAVCGVCTHQGCRLDLTTAPVQLVCPCHGATFSCSGQPLAYPRDPSFKLAPLPRLPLRVQEGNIQVYAAKMPSTPAADTPVEDESGSDPTTY
jgi:cytochrome b6-f complex iron-sulfur subunit